MTAPADAAGAGMPPRPGGHAGRFLTLEGPDGSGKTTQAALLVERLKAHGRDTLLTREPGGGGPIAERIRDLLLHGGDMAGATELLLFFAARAEHVVSLIRPALTDGRVVVCDRYTDSTLAYQGAGLGVDEETILTLHRLATGDLWPDHTILLDVAPEAGLERQRDRNRMEERGVEFARRVRDGFLALAAAHPNRIAVVDAREAVDEVHERIWKHVTGWLDGA
jgi:dTMP kinase